MKKRLFLPLLLISALATTSCDFKETMEMLQQPIHVQGEIDPNFGIPVAYGEVNLSDLMSLLDESYTGMIQEDEIITIYYEKDVKDTIYASTVVDDKLAKRCNNTKSGDYLITKDTTISYTVPIDLFNKSDINEAEISIGAIWLSLACDVRCWGKTADVDSALAKYVSVTFDQFEIDYVAHDGTPHQMTNINMTPLHLEGNTILNGTQSNIDSLNMAEIVNYMPSSVTVKYHLNMNVKNGMLIDNISDIDYFQQLVDGLKMSKFAYGANIRMSFPMEIGIGGLPYSYTIDMGEGLARIDFDSILGEMSENMDIDIKNSSMTLRMDNGIPLDLVIDAWMLKAAGDPTEQLITMGNVRAAQTKQIAGTSPVVWESSAPSRDTIQVTLNKQKLEALKDCKKLKIDVNIATPNDASGTKIVAIKRTDNLRMKIFLQVHPSVNIDIPITGGDNNNNNK